MSTNTSSHPDPGMLAAYAEQEVGASERDTIELHLADCAICREIVTGTRDFLDQEDPASKQTYTKGQVFGALLIAAVAFAVLVWFAWYTIKNAESYHAPIQHSGTAR